MARKPKDATSPPAEAPQSDPPKKRVSAPWFVAQLFRFDDAKIDLLVVGECPDLRAAEGLASDLAEKQPGQTFIPVKFGDRVQKREIRRIETVAQPLFEGGFKPVPAASDLTEGLES